MRSQGSEVVDLTTLFTVKQTAHRHRTGQEEPKGSGALPVERQELAQTMSR